jgi:hypothetical protein
MHLVAERHGDDGHGRFDGGAAHIGEVTEFLNGFLEARITGEGAQQYLNSLYPDILWEAIPLLYPTSSGAPYERAEFEPSMRILAIAIVAPESRFERVVEAAAPVVDSIEFHAPRPTLQFEILDRAFRARQPGGLRVGVVVRRRLSGCSAHEQPRLPCLRSSRWSRRTR